MRLRDPNEKTPPSVTERPARIRIYDEWSATLLFHLLTTERERVMHERIAARDVYGTTLTSYNQQASTIERLRTELTNLAAERGWIIGQSESSEP